MVGLQLVWQLNAEALAPLNSIPKIAQKLWIDCAVCKFISLILVLVLGVVSHFYSITACAEGVARSTNANKSQMLKSGATVNDVCSRRVIGESWEDGQNAVLAVLVGDRLVFEDQEGKAIEIAYFDAGLRNTELARYGNSALTTCLFIQSAMFQSFRKQKELIGQANLSIRVNDDHSCTVLTKTLYVPGSQPYMGGRTEDIRVLAFWQQIQKALSQVASTRLNVPGPRFKSFVLELVIGRDPSKFPRYSTPFNGLIVRDSHGKSTHAKVFVRDAREQ